MAGHDVVIVHSNCLFMPRLMQQRAHRQVLNAVVLPIYPEYVTLNGNPNRHQIEAVYEYSLDTNPDWPRARQHPSLVLMQNLG